MQWIHLDWPWLGLAVAILLGGILFRPGALRPRDAGWLAWLGVAAYMLHQFEEHGIDLTGQRYAFRPFFCHALGVSGPDGACPIPPAFFTMVNVGAVWLSTLLGAVLGQRGASAVWALSAAGLIMINAPIHVVPAILQQTYNPGLLSSILVFVPYSARALTQAGLSRREKLSVIAGGVLGHLFLLVSVQLFLRGLIGEGVLGGAQLLNAFVPLAAVAAGQAMERQ